MIRAVVVGDNAVKAWLESRYPLVEKKMSLSMTSLVMKLTRKIKEEKLSGQVLKNQTGRLRRSISPNVFGSGASVTGEVKTNVVYASIHEYGGQTKPHVILPKRGRALAFEWGGKQVFFRKVNHPGSKMPERSFMRTALAEMKPEILAEFNNALAEVVRI